MIVQSLLNTYSYPAVVEFERILDDQRWLVTLGLDSEGEAIHLAVLPPTGDDIPAMGPGVWFRATLTTRQYLRDNGLLVTHTTLSDLRPYGSVTSGAAHGEIASMALVAPSSLTR